MCIGVCLQGEKTKTLPCTDSVALNSIEGTEIVEEERGLDGDMGDGGEDIQGAAACCFCWRYWCCRGSGLNSVGKGGDAEVARSQYGKTTPFAMVGPYTELDEGGIVAAVVVEEVFLLLVLVLVLVLFLLSSAHGNCGCWSANGVNKHEQSYSQGEG